MSEMDPFEKELAGISREALPTDWKSGILDAAEAAQEVSGVPVTLVGPFLKVALGAIAACWVTIGCLHLATPSMAEKGQLAERFGIEEESLPLVAQRISAHAMRKALLDSQYGDLFE